MAFFLASCSQYTVYSVSERPSHAVSGGVIYALPHTLVRVAVTIDKQDLSSAPYSQFAQEMLSLPTASPDSIYSIRHIEVCTINEADPDAYFFVNPKRTAIAVDGRGLLVSVGGRQPGKGILPQQSSNTELLIEEPVSSPEYNLYERADTFYTRYDSPGRPSLVTSAKDVRTLRQQASAAAENIEEIRERKQALLFGEYEGNLSAEAIAFLYKKLDAMEREKVCQFTGDSQTETIYFYVDPKDEKTAVEDQTMPLFRFDPVKGLLDADSDEGLLVACNIRCENHLRKASRFIRFRTKSVGSGNILDRHSFKYRIPEVATVTIYSHDFHFEKQVKVAQFGTVANLPKGKCIAIFDPKTGDLLYYGQQ